MPYHQCLCCHSFFRAWYYLSVWLVIACLSLLQLGIQLSREGVGIRSTGFSPPLCCSWLRPRLWFVSVYVVVNLAFNYCRNTFYWCSWNCWLDHYLNYPFMVDRIGSVFVNVLTLGVVVSEFEPQFGQIKDYILISCFSAKHSIRGWQHRLAGCRNLDNEWNDISTRRLMSWHNKNPTKRINWTSSRRFKFVLAMI